MKYRSIVLLLSSFLFLQCTSTKPAQKLLSSSEIESEKEQIMKVMNFQEDAWSNGDVDAFMKGYWKSEKLRFTGSRGVTYGWQNTLESYKRGYPSKESMGKLTFEILELDFLSPVDAIMLGRYTLKRTLDEPTGLFTLTWKKFDGQWLITSDMTCG